MIAAGMPLPISPVCGVVGAELAAGEPPVAVGLRELRRRTRPREAAHDQQDAALLEHREAILAAHDRPAVGWRDREPGADVDRVARLDGTRVERRQRADGRERLLGLRATRRAGPAGGPGSTGKAGPGSTGTGSAGRGRAALTRFAPNSTPTMISSTTPAVRPLVLRGLAGVGAIGGVGAQDPGGGPAQGRRRRSPGGSGPGWSVMHVSHWALGGRVPGRSRAAGGSV